MIFLINDFLSELIANAPSVLQKDVKNLVSKHIFARWQALLSCFDFEIIHIKGDKNALPDFLTRKFL